MVGVQYRVTKIPLVLLAAAGIAVVLGTAFATIRSVPAGTRAQQADARKKPKAAPPQGRIVYSAQVSPEEYTASTGRCDLFLLSLPSGQVQRLTDHRAAPHLRLGGAISEPRFSPDGSQVLFLADYEGSPEQIRLMMTGRVPYPYTLLNIWMLDVATGAVRAATHDELGWRGVRWSPDGRWFCAVHPSRAGTLQYAPPDDLYVFDARTLRPYRVFRAAGRIGTLFWSRDGSDLVFQGGSDLNLYAVSRQGGKPRVLVRGQGGRHSYSLSPNGLRVAFVQQDTPRDDTVYLAQRDGSSAVPVARTERSDGFRILYNGLWPQLLWSRDGSQLAIAEHKYTRSGTFFEDVTRLHVLDVARGEARTVATLSEVAFLLGWSDDGRWLIVRTQRRLRESLSAVSADDGRIVVLKGPGVPLDRFDWRE